MGFQAQKGYLLYTPSTYLGFDSRGISFRKFNKEYKFLAWENIQEIDLRIEGEWLLTMFIKLPHQEVVRAELTELWLLSITKRRCVNHNFLKLLAIANQNPNLMIKLIPEQIEELKMSSGIKLKG
jgi:hypothetical protein